MINNIFANKSKWIKILHIILFITTGLYILESIFIRGLFSNIYLACINMILSIISLIAVLIKKDYKLAIIDLVIFCVTLGLFTFLIYL